ncbi:MAG: MFS transporter [Firmicutes bacterium]|nr:MFS transporter [Bacillota bacterium]
METNAQINQSSLKLNTYTKKEMNVYLMSMFGQNMIYNIINACFAYYLQFTILIPAVTIGVIFGIARVWDAFNDPIMGTIVDKTNSKRLGGKCVPYLKIMPIPITIVTILCFTSFGFYTDMDSGMRVAMISWAAFSYLLWGMVYTGADIPLWGVSALMTEDTKERNKLLSVARIVGALGAGIVIFSMQSIVFGLRDALAPHFSDPRNAERYAFLIVASSFAIFSGILFQLCGFVVKERVKQSEKKPTLKENLKIMWRNKPFRQVLISGIIGSPKMLIATVALPIVSYYFASKDGLLAMLYMALLGGGLFVGQFVFMALAPKFLHLFSKKTLYNASHILMAIPFAMIFGLYLIAPMNLTDPIALVLCFLLYFNVGGGFGMTTVLQSFMIADAIDYEEYHYGGRPDGVFFSGQTFLAKLSAGIAALISAGGYAIVGFSDKNVEELNAFIDAGGVPRVMEQYQPFMFILFFLVSIPPLIGSLLAIIPTLNYALDDKEHARIVAELAVRRHQLEKE